MKDAKVNPVLNAVRGDYEAEEIGEEETEETVRKSGYKADRLRGMETQLSRPSNEKAREI